ncbi:MAG TPA: hypothetical protein DD473_04865 [Planctomycetaceae bacterium]|nr:hypothetical protein [Planctomycetaceae bacterium]
MSFSNCGNWRIQFHARDLNCCNDSIVYFLSRSWMTMAGRFCDHWPLRQTSLFAGTLMPNSVDKSIASRSPHPFEDSK